MKTKIFLFVIGVLFLASCSEDFITRDLDKGSYIPSTFYDTEAKANQGINAIYAGLRNNNFFNWHFVFGDDFAETGYAAGFMPWPATLNFDIRNSDGNVANIWNMAYANILRANLALQEIPNARDKDPEISPDDYNLMMGQAYFLRAFNYYYLYWYYPQDKIVLRTVPPTTLADYSFPPSTSDEVFKFIESDLKNAQELLVKGLSTTRNYEKFRATRGAAAAYLGKLYMMKKMYTEAAAEFKKILPGVGDAAYGTYALADDYRRNFTIAGENTNSSVNTESIFEIYYEDLSENMTSNFLQNMTMSRNTQPDQWWNFAIPKFKLDEFETWTEEIDGKTTTVYDYRAYQTFWGVPNGANFTASPRNGGFKDWVQQLWHTESAGSSGIAGALGMRKYAVDSDAEFPSRGTITSEVNIRLVRLADIMLLYAECLANINPGATGADGAAYWVDMVRERANKPMGDQSHLYSARPDVKGQLPPVSELMAAKGWNLMQVIEHERYVEGYAEGWNKEDLKRWEKGADYVKYKSNWQGYQSLTLPVPLSEEQNNPNMPK
ncbi:MAG: RagB/SusD family nutrient uptake outer membrane protein [Bacteroidales bacterium]|nr:RagB/SusD family nutrient uptake outer membrane protein [Bacteroidales bacterium]